jgi:CRISPR-associated protein Cas1
LPACAEIFASILHAPVLDMLEQMTRCRRTRALITLWLSGFSRAGRGLPQGSPLSPLLSNLALSPVDRLIDGRTVRLV